MTIFGGTTPAVATFLIEHFDSRMAPAVYVIVAAAISGVVVLTMRETVGRDIED